MNTETCKHTSTHIFKYAMLSSYNVAYMHVTTDNLVFAPDKIFLNASQLFEFHLLIILLNYMINFLN